MNIKQLARPFFIIALVLGLAVGCASTPEESTGASSQSTAAQAISAAKAENAKAKKMGAEWRDTGKLIKKAKKAMAAGDEAKAMKLADKARRQAETAQKQYKAEEQRLRNNGSIGGSTMPDAVESTAVSASSGADSYQVVRGDNLWNISAKDEIYSNPYQWPLIYKANRNKIKDADLIYAGQVFDIERGASAGDIDAAVQHAKTRGAWSVGVTEDTDSAYLAE